MNSQSAHDDASLIRRVYARVTPDPPARRESILERLKSQPDYDDWQPLVAPPNRLPLRVTLSAEDTARRRIVANGSFFIAGPRRYRGGPLDIEAKINRTLGRDPKLHRPQRLAWEHLISALAHVHVWTTEEELIACPLTVELDDGVRAALEEP